MFSIGAVVGMFLFEELIHDGGGFGYFVEAGARVGAEAVVEASFTCVIVA